AGLYRLFFVGSLGAQMQQTYQGRSTGLNTGLNQAGFTQFGFSQGTPGQTSTATTGGAFGPSGLSTLATGLPSPGSGASVSPFLGLTGLGQASPIGTNPAFNQGQGLGVGSGNPFYTYYGNPLYQGWPGNFPRAPGGWSAPLYQASTSGTFGTTGSAF